MRRSLVIVAGLSAVVVLAFSPRLYQMGGRMGWYCTKVHKGELDSVPIQYEIEGDDTFSAVQSHYAKFSQGCKATIWTGPNTVKFAWLEGSRWQVTVNGRDCGYAEAGDKLRVDFHGHVSINDQPR